MLDNDYLLGRSFELANTISFQTMTPIAFTVVSIDGDAVRAHVSSGARRGTVEVMSRRLLVKGIRAGHVCESQVPPVILPRQARPFRRKGTPAPK